MTGENTSKEMILKYCSPQKEVPFSRNEYRNRLSRVRQIMARENIDLLFLSAPESLFYISGYQAEWYQSQSPRIWPPASGIAIHVDHNNFIQFDTEEEEILCRYTTVSPDVRIYRETAETTGMLSWIARELKKEGWLPGTVGLEMQSYRPNRVVSETFQSKIEKEGGKVVDGTDIVKEARAVKSPQEIAYVEKAVQIAEIGMTAAIELIRPGMTELQVYGEIVHAMAKAGGENPGIPVLVTSGPKSACLHALASRKKIQKGEIVNVDICGVYNRYHGDIARSLSMGKPNPDVAKVVELSARVFEVLGDLIRPNLPVSELNHRMKAYYQETGILQDRWWVGGYELGIAFPPDWVGEFVYDMDLDAGDKLFVPGTVVNYESNFYLPHKAGVSYQINTLIFAEKQARILGEIPNDLIVIER